ncbi:GD21955 [Drosophila simulans]|uniref:GD21955 n=1 Tax=Drosophila simulans TaxID=7240 RepID=B4Q6F0_DROSI|nr:GD21955 [Drosophila simulans]
MDTDTDMDMDMCNVPFLSGACIGRKGVTRVSAVVFVVTTDVDVVPPSFIYPQTDERIADEDPGTSRTRACDSSHLPHTCSVCGGSALFLG